MPNSPRVITNVINLTDVPSIPIGGIHNVMGVTERGEHAKPDTIITSWSAFQRIYGGLLSTNDFPLICKRALDKGAYLRVSRVGHYTDPTNASTLEATLADSSNNATIKIVGQFSSGNTFNVTLNGIAISQVTYTTSHANTMELIRVQLEAHAAVSTATVLEGNQAILLYSSSPLTITALSTTGVTASSSTDLEYLNQKGEVLFKIEPKGKGAGYNGMIVNIAPAGSNYSSLVLTVSVGGAVETFPITLESKIENGQLVIDDINTIANINNNSTLIRITDLNAAAPYTSVSGTNMTHVAAGGTNGGSVVDTDYIGDSSAKTGIYAFDPYADGSTISAPGRYTTAVHIAGASYTSVRKDLMYLAEVDPANTTVNAIKAARENITSTNKYTMVFAGGLKIKHPSTGVIMTTSVLGDIIANISSVHQTTGPWGSFANQKGIITGAIGVNADFGSASQYADRNILSNAQVNLVLKKSSQIMQWGNFTAQTMSNVESFASVVFTIMYLRRTLEPTLENFLEEPADIPTFKRIFLTVKPLLDSLVGKAYSSYKWDGDQDATSISTVQVNTPNDLQQGLYKINFYIKTIVPIQEIKVNIVLTSAGVSFDEAQTLI